MIRSLLSALVLSGLVLTAAPQPVEDISRATLSNGLRVVIVRSTLAPVVTTAVNYLVGSNESPRGYPGTAHALEHMMFRGSPDLSADQLANIAAAMGGEFNAETQQKILQRFHFALNGDGRSYLFLGRAEMLLGHSSLFTPVNLKCRIFAKVPQPWARPRLRPHDDRRQAVP